MTMDEVKKHLVKVTKPVARKAFDKGLSVFLIARGDNLYSPWVCPVEVTNADGNMFDNCLNHFSYYNQSKNPWYFLMDTDCMKLGIKN